MRFTCVICTDPFHEEDDFVATQCGHVFHYHCLLHWIESSKTCPQCRSKATESKLLKLYMISSESTQQDPDTLSLQVEALQLQIRQKSAAKKGLEEERDRYKQQATNLRALVKDTEEQLRTEKANTSLIKEQLQLLMRQQEEVQVVKKKSEALKKKMEHMERVQELLDASSCDVEDMLSSYNDKDVNVQLVTYCCILKAQLNKSSELKQKLKEEVNNFSTEAAKLRLKITDQQRLSKMLKEKEEDLRHLEAENQSLRKKISKLEESVISPSGDVKNSMLRRVLHESPAPAQIEHKRPRLSDPAVTPDICRDSGSKGITSDSPYLNVKMSAVGATLARKPNHSQLLSKKPNTSIFRAAQPSSSCSQESGLGYDGLGGHSKYDPFPKAVKRPVIKKKTKKPLLKTASSFDKRPAQNSTIKSFFDP